MRPRPWELGVLLIGIGFFILVIFSVWTFFLPTLFNKNQNNGLGQFSGYCAEVSGKYYIIITSESNVSSLVVLNDQNKTICSFKDLRPEQQVFCKVNETGVYEVKGHGFSQVVVCQMQGQVLK